MNEFGVRVAAALGLPDNNVSSIKIDIQPSETTVEVRLIATSDQLRAIGLIISEYQLVAKGHAGEDLF